MEAGVPVRHITAGRNVPMYDTSIECRSAGAFHSTMVVSMRGIPSTQVADACRISGYYSVRARCPRMWASRPRSASTTSCIPTMAMPPVLEPGDVPVFWACGVTPQAAVMVSKPEFAITHAPGHMFIHQQTRFGIHGVRGECDECCRGRLCYRNRYEQRYGRKLRSLDTRRRRGAARRGFQRERA